MSTYSAGDIIGKTLIAATSVPVKKLPLDTAPIIRKIAIKAPIGVVYSYVSPATGRKNLYWQFYDTNNNAYWVEHVAAYFDLQALRDQGVLTSKEKEEAKARENESVKSFIERNLTRIVLVVAGVALLKTFIQNRINK